MLKKSPTEGYLPGGKRRRATRDAANNLQNRERTRAKGRRQIEATIPGE